MTTQIIAPQQAIDVAATIGFGIARRALWSGARCTWFDAIPTLPTQNPAVSAIAGPDIYGGTSGIGWFLAQAATRSGDALLRRTARAALRQSAARADPYVDMAPHGFYGGMAGVGAALVLAGRELDDGEAIAAGRALLLRLPTDTIVPDVTDLIGGIAGTVLALALAADALDRDAALLARAGAFAERLIARGERDTRGTMSWPTLPEKRANLTGFAHGTAGIAHALLLLDAVAPDPALREAATAAFAYETATFDRVQQNWPDFRLFPGQAPGPPPFLVAWCHGAAGIARSRLFAEACGFQVATDVAAALGTTARYGEQWFRMPNADYTACHGLFGIVDTLLDGLASGRAAHTATLAAIVAHATEHFHRDERAWPSGLISHEEISGLMLGNAGIGHVYLRLADPSLRSLLAPVPQQEASYETKAMQIPA
ncbi:MAG TPA: lanthionine synthetase LanC family protein [Xanthobacteraceae bacterium]|nr:lanthionine synthetase LanC family protein [Xanthobacteraceae bacterium]